MDIDKMLNEALKDEEVKALQEKYNLSREFLAHNLPTILTQIERKKICESCKGEKLCAQQMSDMISELYYYNNKLNFNFKNCKYKELLNEDFVELLFVSENNHAINKELYKVAPRANIIKGINTFLSEYLSGLKPKGMYIHGPFGVGKTFLLLKLANKLAKEKIKVLFVYYPDLVRSIKSSVGTNNLETYVEKLKTAEVLFLDDFGAESNSNFIRDEVLGPILQYRSSENLPVFFSSNLTLDEVKEHLEESKLDSNPINSSRIIERIKILTNDFELKDRNYRNVR